MKFLSSLFMNLISAPNSSATLAAATEEGMKWHPEKALETLDNMGIGMLVIFVIIGAIILTTIIVNKIFSKKK